MSEALFAKLANQTIQRVQSTFEQRGAEYGDTWKECQWRTTLAVAKKIGVSLTPVQARLIVLAGFVDMKHERLLGEYKDDSLIDGIAYTAALAQDMADFFTMPEN